MYTRTIYNNKSARPLLHNKQEQQQQQQQQKMDLTANKANSARGSELITLTRDKLLDLITEMLEKNSNVGQHKEGPANVRRVQQSANIGQGLEQQRPVTRQDTARPLTRSENPDFGRLVWTTYRHVQVRHALENWNNLPKGVDGAVNRLTKSILPPMRNERLDQRLKAAADDFKSQIAACVHDHLTSTLQENARKLKELNLTDVELAHAIVRRKMRRTLGKRMRVSTVDSALEEAAHGLPSLHSEPEANDSTEPWSTVRGRRNSATRQQRAADTVQHTAAIVSTGRFDVLRSPEEPDASQPMFVDNDFPLIPPTEKTTRRRFRSDDSSTDGSAAKRADVEATPPAANKTTTTMSSAAGTVDDDDQSDVEPSATTASVSRKEMTTSTADVDAPTPTGNEKRHRASSLPPVNRMDQIASSLGQLYSGKDCWSHVRDTPSTTVVMADSNGRNWTSTPPGWTILSRSGARLEDATHLLKSSIPISKHVKNLIIAVGVNNAVDVLSMTTIRLTALHTAATKHGTRVFFVEIPTHPRSTEAQIRAIDHMNKTARDLFTARFFVDAPSDLIVTANSGNSRDTVHYNKSTADQIIAHLQQVVDNLN